MTKLADLAARIHKNVRANPAGQIDVARDRKMFEGTGRFAKLAPGVKYATSEIHGVPCEAIVPEEHDHDRSIVYFHGGAFCMGTPAIYRGWLSHLAVAARAEVWVVDYRLAPEHPFPAAVDDAFRAWKSIQTVAALTSSRTVMMGDSAGGNLTLATLVRARDEGVPLPTAAALISPWLDLSLGSESMDSNAETDPLVRKEDSRELARLYLNGTPASDPRASPLFAKLEGLPPIYVQASQDESLRDDATRFAARAKEAGVNVTLDLFHDVFHVWHFFAGLPEADDAIARLGAFARKAAPSRPTS